MQVLRAYRAEVGRGRGSLPRQGQDGWYFREGGSKTGCSPNQGGWSWGRAAFQGRRCDWSKGAGSRGVGASSRTDWVGSLNMHAQISHCTPTLLHFFLHVKPRQGSLNNPPVVYGSCLEILNTAGRCSSPRTWYRKAPGGHIRLCLSLES